MPGEDGIGLHMYTEVSAQAAEDRRRYIVRKRFGALLRMLLVGAGVWIVLANDPNDFVALLGAALALSSGGDLVRDLVSLSRYTRTWADSMWSWSPCVQGGDWLLHLDSPGRRRLSLRVAISDLTGLDVRKARDLVEDAPCVVATGLSAQGAQNAAALLDSWGAVTRTTQDVAE